MVDKINALNVGAVSCVQGLALVAGTGGQRGGGAAHRHVRCVHPPDRRALCLQLSARLDARGLPDYLALARVLGVGVRPRRPRPRQVRHALSHGGGARTPARLALVSALAIVVGFVAALPATFDYITFYKIKSSADAAHPPRLSFSASMGSSPSRLIVRYAVRAWRLLRGKSLDDARATEAAT